MAPKVRIYILETHIVQDDSIQLTDAVPTVSTANEDENMDFILERQENCTDIHAFFFIRI